MKHLSLILRYKWYIVSVLVMASGVYYYTQVYGNGSTETAASYYVVNTVEKGAVSSGVVTTGKIIAAQKLDLDVYKLLSRISVVNVSNGSHVDAGTVVISFDKSDAVANAQTSKVNALEAELELQNEKANATDPSTQMRTLEGQILGYKNSIATAEKKMTDGYRDYLNANLEAVSEASVASVQGDDTAPTVSGRYISDIQGEYIVEIYRSNSESGYSYKLSGLESGLYPIFIGKASDLGTRGLKITFPTSLQARQKWVVAVPNVHVATYTESKADYEKLVTENKVAIVGYKASLLNAEQELVDLKRTDTTTYRNLNVEKAKASLEEAQQQLSQKYDVLKERDIIAPFAGTVQDMENVVVGATPTGGTSDPTNLGTLISDEFLTTFTLSATDVAKVKVGQKVNVTLTSLANQPKITGSVIEVSSLPSDTGVAQYEVRALLDYDAQNSKFSIREGMLTDVEVVDQEKTDALRIPTSAVTYRDGKATVEVIDSLTAEQQKEVDTQGIVRTTTGTLSTYPLTIELGIRGTYFVEVLSGIPEGKMVLTSSVKQTATSNVVEQSGPGGGPQGGRTTNTNTTRVRSTDN